jgi:uncharacterized SAM-binding protein YcdF (DUF218 family)
MELNKSSQQADKPGQFLKIIGGSSGCFILFCFGLICLYFSLYGLGGFLIVADPLQSADAMVVLSGDMERMSETATLFKDNFARVLILTETDQPFTGSDAPETNSTLAKRLQAQQEGIPADAILVTRAKSNSTLDEARVVLALLQEKGFSSCIVVTDPFHSRRTRMIFQDVFGGSGIKVIIRPVRDHWYRSSSWWLSQKGWQATTSEYLKYVAYLLGIKDG